MAKNPILPLYYNDIDRSTRDWTDEEFGAFMRLLMEQWDKGILPNDYQRLTRIATSLPTTWDTIKSKFVEVAGGLQNLRMEVIREERLKFSKKQSKNVKKRYQTSTKHSTKTLPSYEDEHEIEKEDVIDTVLWDTIKVNFKNAYSWKEKFCRDKNISESQLDFKMTEFISDVELKEDYKDLKELKRHFTNWFNKHKNGTHKQTTSGGGEKLGTSAARIKAARDF